MKSETFQTVDLGDGEGPTDIATNEMRIAPNSRPQMEFFASEEDEVLYGGAAGAGKSMALVMDPCRYIQYPRFTGIIFRRTFPELEGSILPHTRDIYPHLGGTYNIQSKTWTFPSGAFIRLGYMQYEEDWRNYAGHEYAYQGYDELTTFRPVQWGMLDAWNRSKQEGVPAYRRGATNPGGTAHAYVKQNFVDPMPPVPDGPELWNEIVGMKWQPMRSGGPFVWKDPNTGGKTSRKFIPAKVFDNEDLLRRNPKYIQKLLRLPEYRRRALLEGRWDIFEGQFFGMWRSDVHVIPPRAMKAPPTSWQTLGGLDYGNVTVLEVLTKAPDGTILNFAECYTTAETPEEKAEDISRMLIDRQLHRLKIVHDVDLAYTYQAYGGIDTPLKSFNRVMKARMGERRPRFTVVSKKRMENYLFRVACNEIMRNYLAWQQNEKGEITRRPKFLATGDSRHLITTLPELVHDPDSHKGMDFDQESGEDHPYDACYSSETEVLTSDGWKIFGALTYLDELATLATDYRIVYQRPTKLIRREHDGDLLHFKNTSMEFAVTDDHQMVTVNYADHNVRGLNHWDLTPVTELPMQSYIPRMGDYRGIHNDVVVMPPTENGHRNQSESINTDSLMKFLGFWLAEGCASKVGSHYRIIVDQKDAEVAKAILDKLPFHYNTYKVKGKDSYRFTIYSLQLWKWYEQNDLLGKRAPEKRIPRWILNLDRGHLHALWEGMLLGDGSVDREGRTHYDTVSKGLADDVQELLFKLGYVATIASHISKHKEILGRPLGERRRLYRVTIRSTRTFAQLDRVKIKKVHYVGDVYCATVPLYHTLYVRLNGKPMWCGNCKMALIKLADKTVLRDANQQAPEKMWYEEAGAFTPIREKRAGWRDPFHV